MKITKELLIEKGACDSGARWFGQHFPNGGELDDLIQSAKAQECPSDFVWWFYNNVHQDKHLCALCGVNESNGVNGSYGCLSCHGIDQCLFCYGITGRYFVFNKPSSKKRVEEIYQEVRGLLYPWKPVFNNIKALYLANGSDWKLTPVHNAEELSIKEAWSGMPAAAIEYVRSLPEFDADIFEKITGITQEESRA